MTRGFVISALIGRAARAAAGHSAPRAMAAPSISASIEDLSFVPAQLSVTVGTTVVFVNHGRLPHSVVGTFSEKGKTERCA
ncbi:MAG TPA: plastocyanin/azurin family copper-binding protein [Methylocystis sp.]|jgi:plastocyanin